MEFKASLNIFINPLAKLLHKFESIRFSYKLVLLYLATSFLFIIFHERHLPLLFIAGLSLATAIFSAALIALTLLAINYILNRENALIETVILALAATGLYFSGFLSHKSGILFLLILYSVLIAFKLTNKKLYFHAAVTGVLILANAVMTFSFLQFSEITTLYYMNQSKYGQADAEIKQWEYTPETRNLVNRGLGIELKLPPEMYYFKNEDLDMNSRYGTGHLLLAISSSDKNPARYPTFKILFLPGNMSGDDIYREFKGYLEILTGRNDIEEVKELADYTETTHNWTGKFWLYYDNIQPRYAKTGYYLVKIPGGQLLLQISETLTKDTFHGNEIKALLDSFKLLENIQGNQ